MFDRNTQVRVGLLVVTSLIVAVLVIFTVGSSTSLFASRQTYRAVFANVDGLRVGSPVRMSGVDVGTVGRVSFRSDGRCEVEFGVRESEARFVTSGSRVSIGSKGLLGDKLVEVTAGQGTALAENSVVESVESGGLMGSLTSLGEQARPALENARRFTETLGDDAFRANLQAISANLAELTRLMASEDGTVHRLLTDPQLADNLSRLIANSSTAATELAGTARSVRAITREIESGNGSAHRIIYGEEGALLASNLARTAGELASLLEEVRTGEGNAHELVYGDGQLARNLTTMSENLRSVSDDLRAGRGTLGALMTDPSLYEDLKRLVGNLQRNEVLRALVRYSIAQGGAEDERQVEPPASEAAE